MDVVSVSASAGQILGDHDGIEFLHGIRAADTRSRCGRGTRSRDSRARSALAVRAQCHDRVVDVAVARIEDIAVRRSASPLCCMSLMIGMPSSGMFLALVLAGRTGRRRRAVARPRKQLGGDAFVGSRRLSTNRNQMTDLPVSGRFFATGRPPMVPPSAVRRQPGAERAAPSATDSRHNQPCQFPCQLALSVRLRPPESTNCH